MPTLFPLIDALPNWVIYAVLILLIAGAIEVVKFVQFVALMIRYEWKYWRHRRREASIASDRMQAAAERYRR